MMALGNRQIVAFVWCLLCGGSLQSRGDEGDSLIQSEVRSSDSFRMVRVEYDSMGGNGEAWYAYEGRIWQRWETDYPRAELNFLFRLSELTSLVSNPVPMSLKLTDDRLFDYPFVFMSDVGWQTLSREEMRVLKVYLENGGFLWVDDFWGSAEWDHFERVCQRAFPEWEWRELAASHPILNAVYPLDSCPQVPARLFYENTGLDYDPPWIHRQPNGGAADLSQVHLKGLFNREGRMLAVATHNTDIADGWEREGEDKEYFERFSVRTYALGINILVYAFTH
jgi:hypothetical protein